MNNQVEFKNTEQNFPNTGENPVSNVENLVDTENSSRGFRVEQETNDIETDHSSASTGTVIKAVEKADKELKQSSVKREVTLEGDSKRFIELLRGKSEGKIRDGYQLPIAG